MVLTRLVPADWARFRTLRLQALTEAPDAFGSTLEETATRPEQSWIQQLEDLATFCVVVDGVDVGMVRGGPDPEVSGRAWLLSMWVSPAVRGRGIGSQLVAAVLRWARENGFREVALDVADDNVAAVSLYASMGFEPNGVTGSLPAPREHVLEHQRIHRLG